MIRAFPLVILMFAASALAGCAPSVGLPYERQAPPQALVPSSLANVEDRRGRFREIFCALNEDHGRRFAHFRPCRDALHSLAGEPPPTGLPVAQAPPRDRRRVLIVPGIFGECVSDVATPFDAGAAVLRDSQGYSIDVIPVSGRSGSAANAAAIRDWLAQRVRPGERLLFVGYSKGVSDLLETLGRYPDSIPAGSAIVSVAGVVAGTPIADRWEAAYGAVGWLPFPGCGPGDRDGVTSLTRRDRLGWLERSELPRDRRYFSLAAFAPQRSISRALRPFHAQLSRIDAWNDGQLLHHDAIIPGGVLLGYAVSDHWALTLDLARKPLTRAAASRNAYPREILFEAIVRAVEEDDAGRP